MREKICGFQNAATTKPVVDDTKEYKNREEINTTVKGGKMKKVINVPVREGKITGSPVVPSFFASSCVNFEDASIGKKSPSKSGSWGFHSADREKGRKKTKQREKRKKKRPKRAKNKKISFFFVFFFFFFF